MEQQKVLWIIFSVTLFLVVVVVVGFVWFLPPEDVDEPGSAAATAGAETSEEVFDPIVWVREDGEVPGMREEAEPVGAEEEGDLLLIYGEAQEQPVKVRIPEPETGAAAVQDKPAARTPPPAQIPEKKPAPPAAAPSRQPIVRAAAVPAPKPEPRTERITHYWIQLGSYRSQARAEQAQADLAERGWDTRIISRDVEGAVFFRVRFGPFETKDEAGKFLGWITDIETFESSYISEVYTTRTMN